jgi:hypothetical protein
VRVTADEVLSGEYLDPSVGGTGKWNSSTDYPTASDDDTAGYSIGSYWVVPGEAILRCLDNATGAAVWYTVTDDTAIGVPYRRLMEVHHVPGTATVGAWGLPAPAVWGSVADSSLATGPFLNITAQEFAVVDASDTAPIVIETSGAHGLLSGQSVTVEAVTGNTAANGDWEIASPAGTTFELVGSSGSGAYAGGGRVFEWGGLYVPSAMQIRWFPEFNWHVRTGSSSELANSVLVTGLYESAPHESTIDNIEGFGFRGTAGGNWTLEGSDGLGAATEIDLGASYAVAAARVYDLRATAVTSSLVRFYIDGEFVGSIDSTGSGLLPGASTNLFPFKLQRATSTGSTARDRFGRALFKHQ